MDELHGWITQQIDTAQQRADRWHDTECDVHDTTLIDAAVLQSATLCDCGGPASVLRRCEADRRVLARHRLDPDAIWNQAAMCAGCGTYGEFDDPETDNLNDCPELLDLGHAHGLTDEILASLDRPQNGERPEPRPGFGMPDALLESMYRAMYEASVEADRWLITGSRTGEPRGILAWKPKEPTPMDRALDILDPELRACPLYDAGPPVVRGPYWR